MGITGSQKALIYALSGLARAGATRAGYHSAETFITINGVQRATRRDDTTAGIIANTLTTTESHGEPSTGSMQTMGFDVVRGQEVIVKLGSINNYERWFAGYVLATSEGFLVGKPNHKVTALSLIDYTWQMNRQKVIGRFSGSATTIVLSLMASYAPDWAVSQVESGLASIDEISFVEPTDLTDALTRIALRIGATWRGSYHKVLYFGVTAPTGVTGPRTLTASLRTFLPESFEVTRDRSQQITRVIYEGGGSEAAADVAVGETILPLTLAADTWYADVGGTVVSGPQRPTYTGRFEGGGGSLVGPGATPSTAPTLALASGSGVDAGSHDVALVFETGSGTSLPGPVATIITGVVSAPSSAPVAGVPLAGIGPDPGAHQFAISFLTAAGETTPSPLSNVVTTQAGVTNPATAASVSDPGNNGIGSLTVGHQYSYKYTHGDANGEETLPSTASGILTISSSQRAAVVAQYSTDPRVTRLYLYRSENGGAGTWKRVRPALSGGSQFDYFTNSTAGGPVTMYDISGVPVEDAPTDNTTALTIVPLTNLPVSPSPLVLSKNIYGTEAGGSQLKLIGNIAASTTSFVVSTEDADLGADAPTSNTAIANQITATFPLGPSGTTARRLYMSPVGGGARKLALTISNNTATSGTITASDATLAGAGAEPSTDTSGLAQPDGQVVAGSTSIIVAGFGGALGFSATGGWAVIGNGQHAVRYTGTSSTAGENKLTGIPATGPGSIMASIEFGSQITACPALTGVSGIVYSIRKGDPVNLLVTVNDVAAQETLSDILDPANALGGAAGIIEETLQDRRLSLTETRNRAMARLTQRSQEAVTVTYTTFDHHTHPPLNVEASLSDPTNLTGTFKILRVTRTVVDAMPPIPPQCAVEASNELFTFEQLLLSDGGA